MIFTIVNLEIKNPKDDFLVLMEDLEDDDDADHADDKDSSQDCAQGGIWQRILWAPLASALIVR